MRTIVLAAVSALMLTAGMSEASAGLGELVTPPGGNVRWPNYECVSGDTLKGFFRAIPSTVYFCWKSIRPPPGIPDVNFWMPQDDGNEPLDAGWLEFRKARDWTWPQFVLQVAGWEIEDWFERMEADDTPVATIPDKP